MYIYIFFFKGSIKHFVYINCTLFFFPVHVQDYFSYNLHCTRSRRLKSAHTFLSYRLPISTLIIALRYIYILHSGNDRNGV